MIKPAGCGLLIASLCALLHSGEAQAWSVRIPVDGVTLQLPDRRVVDGQRTGGVPGLALDRKGFGFSAERTPGVYAVTRSRLHVSGVMKAPSEGPGCVLLDLEAQEKIPLGSSGDFELTIDLNKGAGEITVGCVQTSGDLRSERVLVSFSREAQALARIFPTQQAPRWAGQVGLGATRIDYSDLINGIENHYRSASLTLTGGLHYWIRPGRWLSGASGYYTLLPLTRSGTSNDATARFFGFNLRAGYVLPHVPGPWSVSILGGVYYLTTLVDTGEFGVTNLAGPQLYPSVRYTLKRGDQIGGYLKFSPVSTQLSLISIQNRELAAGLSYLFWRQGMTLSADFSQLDVVYLRDIALELKSRTISLSAGKVF